MRVTLLRNNSVRCFRCLDMMANPGVTPARAPPYPIASLGRCHYCGPQEIAGIAPVVHGLWMSQIARNLTDADDGVLAGKRYLIHDRDPLFTAEFLRTLDTTGVKSVKLPPRSPNLNAHAERFVRGIKESCLDRMIFFGEASLRTAIWNFVEHYHTERNHQGLSNRIICPEEGHLGASGAIQRRQRLGGTLNYYYRAAA